MDRTTGSRRGEWKPRIIRSEGHVWTIFFSRLLVSDLSIVTHPVVWLKVLNRVHGDRRVEVGTTIRVGIGSETFFKLIINTSENLNDSVISAESDKFLLKCFPSLSYFIK